MHAHREACLHARTTYFRKILSAGSKELSVKEAEDEDKKRAAAEAEAKKGMLSNLLRKCACFLTATRHIHLIQLALMTESCHFRVPGDLCMTCVL